MRPIKGGLMRVCRFERLEARELLAATLVGQWRAEDLVDSIADGQPVATWLDSVGGVPATASGQPTLIHGALGGRAAVRFAPSDGVDALRVAAGVSPMSGVGDFTIALVYATASTDLEGGTDQWFQNTGLVDADLFGALADWGLVITRDGRIGAGLGLPAVTQYSSTTGTNDGQVHVAVYARSGGTISLYVDGAVDTRSGASTLPRSVFDMTFGTLQSGALPYSGDIAEIRFYDGDLDTSGARALTRELADYYRNAPPVANDDRYEVDEDGVLTVAAGDGLLHNDTDAESDTLAAVLRNGPSHGSVELAADGSFIYEPSADFFGEDRFTYVARDFSDSVPATVTIDVRPVYDPPLAVPDAFLLAADRPLRLDAASGLLANDANPDRADLEVHLVNDAANGQLQLNRDGSLVYRPRGGFVGADHFSYRVSDGTSETDEVDVLLTVFAQPVLLSEVMTNNAATLPTRIRDQSDGQFAGDAVFPDWIELRNLTSEPFDLSGYHLTDRRDRGDKWTFPDDTVLPARGHVIVFASGADLRDAALDQQGALHTNFKLDARGEYLALTDPRQQVVHAYDPALPPLPADVSYGVAARGERYFSEPTPGEANGDGIASIVAEVTLSVTSGFFDAPFSVELRSATPGATIYYTLDGSPPDPLRSPVYQQPIDVATTTVLRAVAVQESAIASPVATATYLFLDDVISQDDLAAEITENPLWRSQWIDALTQVPTFSLVTDRENLWGEQIGIIANPDGHGRAWERPATLELLNPDGSAGFQIDLGVRIRGGFSRGADKSSFRFFFREAYGADKLRFPLFGDAGADVFDGIDLRTAQNYSWSLSDGERMTFVRDLFSRLAQGELGDPYKRGRFYHLYINGKYWGLYQTDERAEASYAATYFGGSRDDYDVVKASGRSSAIGVELTDGRPDAFYRLWQAAVDGFQENADYFRVQGFEPDGTTRNPNYERLLDVDNLIDYMIITYYTGDKDGPGSRFTRPTPNNFFGIYNREAPDGFKWFEHDSEHSLDTGVVDNVNPLVIENPAFDPQVKENFNPHWLHEVLMANAEYRQRFADRVYATFSDRGALSEEASIDRIDRIAGSIDRAIIAEAARWGGAGQTPDQWARNIEQLRAWVPGRTDVVIEQLRGRDWYPPFDPPVFSQPGGRVAPGFRVGVTAGEGTIYVTTDGSDPREVGGAIHPGAIALASGDTLPIRSAATLRARLYRDGQWSPLNAADFTVGAAADATNLRISEVHYHPGRASAEEAAAGFDDADDFEFIELVNISSETVDLSDVALAKVGAGSNAEGVDFRFATSVIRQLEPGDRVLVVENVEAFAARYGQHLPVAGQWVGKLSNKREQLTLVAGDQTLQQFRYDDRWYPATDGGGRSLDVVDVRGDLAAWGRADGWQASLVVGGTPGRARLPGDVHEDGLVDARDIDQLYAAIGGDRPAARFDLTGDGRVDRADVDLLVQEILKTSYGDVDLDGDVDVTDLMTLFGNFTGPGHTGATWETGDVDGDGDVDNLDLNRAIANVRLGEKL